MKVLASAVVAISTLSSAAFACSPAEVAALSQQISDHSVALVAQDPSNLGVVMGAMTSVAVDIYEADMTTSTCAQYTQVLASVSEVALPLEGVEVVGQN